MHYQLETTVGVERPYLGLHLEETIDGQRTTDQAEWQWAAGITFGWDIRPDDLQP